MIKVEKQKNVFYSLAFGNEFNEIFVFSFFSKFISDKCVQHLQIFGMESIYNFNETVLCEIRIHRFFLSFDLIVQ